MSARGVAQGGGLWYNFVEWQSCCGDKRGAQSTEEHLRLSTAELGHVHDDFSDDILDIPASLRVNASRHFKIHFAQESFATHRG